MNTILILVFGMSVSSGIGGGAGAGIQSMQIQYKNEASCMKAARKIQDDFKNKGFTVSASCLPED